MRKLLVFQHSAREPLGVLDPMLRHAGFRIRYVNFSRQPDLEPDVSRYHGLIVLGGPMNVDQQDRFPHLATEIAAIREALDRDIPILGICLGAQLLAAALGANVQPNNVREIALVSTCSIDRSRLNVNGSSVAIGHPFAATGTRIVASLAKQLSESPTARRGLISVCTAGGMGVVAILEKA